MQALNLVFFDVKTVKQHLKGDILCYKRWIKKKKNSEINIFSPLVVGVIKTEVVHY